MLVEFRILDRYRGLLDVGRHLFKRDHGAAYLPEDVVQNDVARAVEYLCRFGDLAVLEIIDGRDRRDYRPDDTAAEDNKTDGDTRSEERRVGEECRSRW